MIRNGAKRTRTADPLHAMQVLYQLSYGPMWNRETGRTLVVCLAEGLVLRSVSLQPHAAQTWRQTATSLP